MKKEKTHYTGATPITDFKPEKKTYTMPIVVDSFVDDEGESILVLENGNTISELKFNALWKPAKLQVIKKGHKGESIRPIQQKI